MDLGRSVGFSWRSLLNNLVVGVFSLVGKECVDTMYDNVVNKGMDDENLVEKLGCNFKRDLLSWGLLSWSPKNYSNVASQFKTKFWQEMDPIMLNTFTPVKIGLT